MPNLCISTLSLGLARACACHSGRDASVSSVLKAEDGVAGRGEVARIHGFVLYLAMVAARPQLPHLYVPSLSLSLGPIYGDHSGRNAYFTSVLLGVQSVHAVT